MAEERVLDVREIATLVTTLYADRLPASSSSSGVPAQRTSTGVSESSEEHGVVLIRDSSLKSDEAWTERGCSFGSGASGSTSAVPRCGTDGSLGLGAPSPERHGVGGGLAAARALSAPRAARRRLTEPRASPPPLEDPLADLGARVGFRSAYELGRTIGRGASSTVAEATRRRDGVRVAVKVVAPARAAGLADAREEVRMHRLASGLPGVVELLDVFFEDGILYLVQELCAGGELFETIARGDTYDERDAAAVTRRVPVWKPTTGSGGPDRTSHLSLYAGAFWARSRRSTTWASSTATSSSRISCCGRRARGRTSFWRTSASRGASRPAAATGRRASAAPCTTCRPRSCAGSPTARPSTSGV